jgi:hypothetical protein
MDRIFIGGGGVGGGYCWVLTKYKILLAYFLNMLQEPWFKA